ncbi:GPN-loop GTPase 2 [Nymphon striatum]|nr:GPN-loop GTPase 2 [Nymphon striatum]
MTCLKLGPNGGLIYCMEYLEKNIDWLIDKIGKLKNHYIIIDCPGQVELYTHNNAMRNIMERLTKEDYRLAAVHLVDSHYCSDPGKFIAVLLTSLCTMLQMELPHVNVLSKADLIEKFGKLKFNLDFYTDVMDLSYLLDQLIDDPFMAKYNKMNEHLIGLIEDYSLVSFVALNIQVMKQVDKANGYVFGNNEERNIQSLLSCAMSSDFEYTRISDIQEKFINSNEK